MRHLICYIARAFTTGLLVAVVAAPAAALRIRDARIKDAALKIRGSEAQPSAVMTVDGEPAGTSNKRGKFKLSTTSLPPDCVVEVSDGVATVHAVIKYCGPVGPQGPAGPVGPAAQLTAYDATGTPLGLVVGASAQSPATVTLFLEEVGKLMELWVVSGRIGGCTLIFESDDCTGQAYMQSHDLDAAMVCSPDNSRTVWTTSATTPAAKTIQSERQSDGVTCHPDVGWIANVYPVEAVNLPFPLPVATPITFHTE